MEDLWFCDESFAFGGNETALLLLKRTFLGYLKREE